MTYVSIGVWTSHFLGLVGFPGATPASTSATRAVHAQGSTHTYTSINVSQYDDRDVIGGKEMGREVVRGRCNEG